MRIKGLLSFYGVYLQILVGIAAIAVAIDRDYFVQNAFNSIFIVVLALVAPLLVVGLASTKGSFAKQLRLITFLVLKVEAFAITGLLVLFFFTFQFLVNLLVLRSFMGEQIFLNVLLLNVAFIYFLGLIVLGRFQIKQPSAVLIRKKGHTEVFVYQNGVIRHIPDPPTLSLLGYSWDDVVEIGDEEFKAYKQKPAIESVATARLVHTQDKPEDIWIVFGDIRRQVPDRYTLDFIRPPDRRHIEIVTEEQLRRWKEEMPLVSIIRFR